MPSLPAPPAPRLLLGLLLLGSRPAGGTGPESPALPIRPEKEPLPVRGAAGRWAPAGGAGGESSSGQVCTHRERAPGAGGSAQREGGRGKQRRQGARCQGTQGLAGRARSRHYGTSNRTAAASQARPHRLLLRREGLCLGRDVAPGPGGAFWGDALRAVRL